MLLGSLVYIALDVYYLVWLSNVKSQLPPKMASIFSDAIVGYTKKMSRDLIHNVGRRENEVNDAKKEFEDKMQKLNDKKEEQRKKDKAEAANKKKGGNNQNTAGD